MFDVKHRLEDWLEEGNNDTDGFTDERPQKAILLLRSVYGERRKLSLKYLYQIAKGGPRTGPAPGRGFTNLEPP